MSDWESLKDLELVFKPEDFKSAAVTIEDGISVDLSVLVCDEANKRLGEMLAKFPIMYGTMDFNEIGLRDYWSLQPLVGSDTHAGILVNIGLLEQASDKKPDLVPVVPQATQETAATANSSGLSSTTQEVDTLSTQA